MSNPTTEHSTSTRTVRPRWVWAGLALAVLGLAVVSAGVIALSWAWAVPGLVLLAVGVGAATRGGVLADSRTGSVGREAHEVERGGTRQGTAPGADVRDTEAEAVSRRADATRRELLAAAQHTGRPNLAPLGSGLALLVAAWLVVAQWTVYPTGSVPQANALRDLGVALVAALAGLRVAVAGPRVGASAVLGACGAALVLLGLLAPHVSTGVRVEEVVCGVLLVLAGAMAVDHGGVRRATDPTP